MKLNLDSGLVENCRAAAQKIAADVQDFIRDKTTVAVERAILRLLGINDAADGVPLANIVVDAIAARGELNLGAAYWVGNACKQLGLSPAAVAQQVAGESWICSPCPALPRKNCILTCANWPGPVCKDCRPAPGTEEMLARLPMGPAPWLYVIVATGDIMQDVVQAQAAAEQGADIIAVIRTTAVFAGLRAPRGDQEGFGGTYATQENFRLCAKPWMKLARGWAGTSCWSITVRACACRR